MRTIVTSTCLRYIVPFTFSLGFDEACSMVEQQQEEVHRTPGQFRKLWNRCIVSEKGAESDLYDYIMDEFLFTNEDLPQSGNKTGARWVFWSSRESSSKHGDAIEKLKYIDPLRLKEFSKASEEDQKNMFSSALRLKITNLGLYLFRNGLGLVWYELEPDKKQLDSSQLVIMQNLLKELNRSNATYLWVCKSGSPPECAVIYPNAQTGITRYDAPFSLGQWLSDITSFLPKKYLVERRNAWPSLIKSYERLLKSSKIPISGLMTKTLSEKDLRDTSMPDKAVLFTYSTFQEMPSTDDASFYENTLLPTQDKKESFVYNNQESIQGSVIGNMGESEIRQRLAYNLTNGYTDAYECSPEIFKEMRQPFTNAIWYATREGAGYFKWPNKRNRNTFESIIRTKASTDYFSLFVKTLYQSYTLMLLAKQIQDEIPAENIEEMDDAGYEKIGRKYEEVNQFLTRSIVTSVSHIHHQNEYYDYLKTQLRINEDAKSVSTGLDALDALQKEQRHRKSLQKAEEEKKIEKQRDDEEKRRDNNLQEVMGMISLLAIASAFVDCYDFISKFSRDTEGGWWDIYSSPLVFASEVVFIILILGISVYAIWFVRNNKNERKKLESKNQR